MFARVSGYRSFSTVTSFPRRVLYRTNETRAAPLRANLLPFSARVAVPSAYHSLSLRLHRPYLPFRLFVLLFFLSALVTFSVFSFSLSLSLFLSVSLPSVCIPFFTSAVSVFAPVPGSRLAVALRTPLGNARRSRFKSSKFASLEVF